MHAAQAFWRVIPPQVTCMLHVFLKELLGYSGLPGAHKNDPRGGQSLSRSMQLAPRSCLFSAEVPRSRVEYKILRTLLVL